MIVAKGTDVGIAITDETILLQCVLVLSSGPQIYAIPNATGTVANCTVNAPGGVFAENGSDIELINTVVRGAVNGSVEAYRCMYAGTTGDNIDMQPVLSDSIRLLEGSPAIDAADYDAYLIYSGVTTALDDDPRLHDDVGTSDMGLGAVTYLDIGALKFQGTTSCSDVDNDGVCDVDDICPGFDDTIDSDNDGVPDGCDVCPLRATGDVDGDMTVDINDVPVFAAVLLDPTNATAEEFCAADANEDGVVDELDIDGFMNSLY